MKALVIFFLVLVNEKKTRFGSGCSDFDLVDLGGVLVLVVEVRDERVDDGQEVPAFGRLFRDSM